MLHTFFRSAFMPLPLRIIHGAQLTFSLACLLTTLVCLFIPSSRTRLVFALLSPWIVSSITTNTILYYERSAASKGTLNSEKYTDLQLAKMALATISYMFGIAIMSSVKLEGGTWSGYLRQVLDGVHAEIRPLLWRHGGNWLLLWIGLIYGRVMPRSYFEGRIRLGEDVTIALARGDVDEETESDEALVRALQREEPEWEV